MDLKRWVLLVAIKDRRDASPYNRHRLRRSNCNEMMNKKEIVAHKKRIQSYFDPFNKKGSTLSIKWPENREFLMLGIYDSFEVIRVVPFVNKKGEIIRTVFWLFFKSLGYDQGFQFCHTKKMVKMNQEDTYELDLVDDRGYKYHIELIFPELEPELAKTWEKWKEYKEARAEWFASADPQIREWHLQIAKEGKP